MLYTVNHPAIIIFNSPFEYLRIVKVWLDSAPLRVQINALNRPVDTEEPEEHFRNGLRHILQIHDKISLYLHVHHKVKCSADVPKFEDHVGLPMRPIKSRESLLDGLISSPLTVYWLRKQIKE